MTIEQRYLATKLMRRVYDQRAYWSGVYGIVEMGRIGAVHIMTVLARG